MPKADNVPATPKGESAVDIRKVNDAKCAMCHQQGNESRGGDFILSDLTGSLVVFSDSQLTAIEKHVNAGTMPKQTATARAAGVTPLTQIEKNAWIEEIRRRRPVKK